VFVALLSYFFIQKQTIPYEMTNVSLLLESLLAYAKSHNGLFPSGSSSTEVFQKLIDDGDMTSRAVYFDLPGKREPTGNKIKSENVCFDFTRGTDAKSPEWVPIVFPTGYRVDYETGEAIRLSTNSSHAEAWKIAYRDNTVVYPLVSWHYFWKTPLAQIQIMPERPPTKVGATLYQQLTP